MEQIINICLFLDIGDCGEIPGPGDRQLGGGCGGHHQPQQGAAQIQPCPNPRYRAGLRVCPPLLAGGGSHLSGI
jgi:hypothetical protein